MASRDLLVGHVITSDNMAYKKPGDGIPANRYRDLIGKVLSQPVANNEQFKWSDFREEGMCSNRVSSELQQY